MSRVCELTQKKNLVGHRVSHSNIKTKRAFHPNLKMMSLYSEALGRSIRMRISTSALRTVDHVGGLDAFLLKAKAENLSRQARQLQRELVKQAQRQDEPSADPSSPENAKT